MGISNRKEPFAQTTSFLGALFVLVRSDDFKIPLIIKYSCSPSVCVPGPILDTGQRAENRTKSSALRELASSTGDVHINI